MHEDNHKYGIELTTLQHNDGTHVVLNTPCQEATPVVLKTPCQEATLEGTLTTNNLKDYIVWSKLEQHEFSMMFWIPFRNGDSGTVIKVKINDEPSNSTVKIQVSEVIRQFLEHDIDHQYRVQVIVPKDREPEQLASIFHCILRNIDRSGTVPLLALLQVISSYVPSQPGFWSMAFNFRAPDQPFLVKWDTGKQLSSGNCRSRTPSID